jgi:surface polysaccharide O-acyltransferase-like enzyme
MLLLNRNEIALKKHVKKIFKIIFLIIVWSAISFIWMSWIRKTTFSPYELLKGLWVLRFNYTNHLWYLCTLVSLYIFYPLIHTTFHANMKVFYFFLGSVIVFTLGNTLAGQLGTLISFFTNSYSAVDFHINYWQSCYPFNELGYVIALFMLGGLLYRYRSFFNNRKWRQIAICALFVSLLVLSFYGVVDSIRKNKMWDNVWYGNDTFMTLINVVAIFILSINYHQKGIAGKIIHLIGKNTLGIYLIHILIGYLFLPLYRSFEISGNLLFNLAYALFLLLISLVAVLGLKKVPGVRYLFSF